MNFSKLLTLIILFFFQTQLFSQEKQLVYNPEADAKKDIENAVIRAKAENKHVFIQVGGNWCPWCVKMHNFYTTDSLIDSIMTADYVSILLNYSRENRNSDILANYKYPQRFGFPVILILDENGELLHTQNTVYLEEDEGYNKKVFIDFLKAWNMAALNPENYK
ncbi:MAG: thioredoxin family protein [Bacteroidales bacterium]|nr:thioredoxin family protein [Bacteroidales bacterium]